MNFKEKLTEVSNDLNIGLINEDDAKHAISSFLENNEERPFGINYFEITVNDSFCSYRYLLKPEADHLSINDVITKIFEVFNSPPSRGKLYNPGNIKDKLRNL